MRRILESSNDRDKWLARRAQYVTASEVAAVIGQSPFQTPEELFTAKINNVRTPMNAHIQRGIDFEAKILTEGMRAYGVTSYRPWNRVIVNDEYPWLAATPDGFACIEGVTTVLEVKAPSRRKPKGAVRALYAPQVVAQMLVCGVVEGLLIEGIGPAYNATVRHSFWLEDYGGLANEIIRKTKKFHEWLTLGVYNG